MDFQPAYQSMALLHSVKLYDAPAIEKAKKIISKNLIDHWPLPILAAMVGINESKLKIGFKELYKTTPYQFLITLRLEKAKSLLETTHDSIQEIAQKVGFDNYRGLNRAFKRAYSIMPTEYRSKLEICYSYTE